MSALIVAIDEQNMPFNHAYYHTSYTQAQPQFNTYLYPNPSFPNNNSKVAFLPFSFKLQKFNADASVKAPPNPRIGCRF